MANLEPIPAAAVVYDYRQHDDGGVPLWLPHNQGDVFRCNLKTVTGEDCDGLVMLFLHPCTMRRGSTLIPRMTVIHCTERSAKKSLDDPENWAKWFSAMPLPDFSGNGTNAFYGDFKVMGSVPSESLDRTKRVGSLSELGRSHLLHRIIFHLTRLAVPTARLRQSTERVQTELQLQGEWVLTATDGKPVDEAQVVRHEIAFHSYLDRPWPEGSPDVPETIRDRLGSDNDKEHIEAFRLMAAVCDSDTPRTL